MRWVVLIFLFASSLYSFEDSAATFSSEQSDDILSQKIDAFLENYDDLSGAVLVSKKGEILLCRGFGNANYEMGIQNTSQTQFRIASLTKPFTAIAILQLQERGVLSVQDPIAKYLPDFPQGEKITIHHLLTHTSGIPNYYKYFDEIKTCASIDEMVVSFQNWRLEFAPGSQYCYSNSGYTLLAYIIEKVSGQKYGAFLQENIFLPLKMGHSGSHRASHNTAAGYVKHPDHIERIPPVENPVFLIGNGDLFSSIEDLYKWDQALFAGKLLNEKSINSMTTGYIPMKNSSQRAHGYGCFIDRQFGRRVVEYSGSLRGYLSKYARFIDDEVTIILLTNVETDQFCQIYENLVGMVFD